MGQNSSNASSSTSFPFERLPLEVVQEILHYVDDATLTNAIPLVCKQFYGVAASIDFWKERCRVKKRQLPPVMPGRDYDYLYFRAIYFKDPYGRNLIKNPSGEDAVDYAHWERSNHQITIEKPPVGVDDDFASCFATSFNLCRREQVVDLVKEGCDAKLLDSVELRPIITCSEWHSHRWDCASRYLLQCELVDAEGLVLASQEVKCDEVQWAGRKWEQKVFTFSDYPPGVRNVAFKSSGKDLQFWAGWYGSKMAGASVILSFEPSQFQPSVR